MKLIDQKQFVQSNQVSPTELRVIDWVESKVDRMLHEVASKRSFDNYFRKAIDQLENQES